MNTLRMSLLESMLEANDLYYHPFKTRRYDTVYELPKRISKTPKRNSRSMGHGEYMYRKDGRMMYPSQGHTAKQLHAAGYRTRSQWRKINSKRKNKTQHVS